MSDTLALHALVDDAIEEATAVVTEGWPAVGVLLELMFRPGVLRDVHYTITPLHRYTINIMTPRYTTHAKNTEITLCALLFPFHLSSPLILLTSYLLQLNPNIPIYLYLYNIHTYIYVYWRVYTYTYTFSYICYRNISEMMRISYSCQLYVWACDTEITRSHDHTITRSHVVERYGMKQRGFLKDIFTSDRF